MSTGANNKWWYIEQVDKAVIPATPNWKEFLRNSGQITIEKSVNESERIGKPYRSCVRLGSTTVGGEGSIELSYGDYDDFLEALLGGTWAGDELKLGDERRYFAFANEYSDFASADKFIYSLGNEVSSFELSVESESQVTGSFSFAGLTSDESKNDEVTGSTYTAATGNCAFDSFSGDVKIDTVSTSIITSISLSIEKNLEAKRSIGSKYARDNNTGVRSVTGSATLHFDDLVEYKKFESETAVELDLTLSSTAGDLNFLLENVKYTSAQPEVGGAGEVTLSVEFSALYDVSSQTELTITRIP
ncbi:MAG: phage tail tube protein [Psychrobium sp.]